MSSDPQILAVPTETHGRVLVRSSSDLSRGTLLTFHGYGQSADDALADACRLPGIGAWRVVAVQALHRFYSRRDERVIASWMTRQDREVAIADNVAYVNRVLATIGARDDEPLVFAGFSQGASMAYRAARLCERPAAGVMAIAGDLPPELPVQAPWPSTFIGAGDRDHWYTSDKLDADVARLTLARADLTVARVAGAHEWTPELQRAAGTWLTRIVTARASV